MAEPEFREGDLERYMTELHEQTVQNLIELGIPEPIAAGLTEKLTYTSRCTGRLEAFKMMAETGSLKAAVEAMDMIVDAEELINDLGRSL